MLEMDGGLGAAFVEVLDADFPAVLGDSEAFGAGFGANVGAAQVGDDAGGAGNGAPTGNGAPAGHGAAGKGNASGGRLQWINVMSAFILRRFADLVGEGVRTDKGYKDVHLNAVARDLSEFINLEVSGTQVYNHLHWGRLG